MRLVSVPQELTLLHLLEFWEAYPELEALHTQVVKVSNTGHYEAAMALLEPALSYALTVRDHPRMGLLLLYKAEFLYRLQCWDDALTQTRRAVQELRAAVTMIAIYNRAIAHYWEGLLHYIFCADDKALQSFSEVRKHLEDSERDWGFKNHSQRVKDCQNLNKWIRDLLSLQPELQVGETAWILPLYELVDRTLIRTGIHNLKPFLVRLPLSVLLQYLPTEYLPIGDSEYLSVDDPEYLPLDEEEIMFPYLRPEDTYIAVMITENGKPLSYSCAGDVLVLQVLTPASSETEPTLSADQPFVRHSCGKISFRPSQRETEKFDIRPRVLIRKAEEDTQEKVGSLGGIRRMKMLPSSHQERQDSKTLDFGLWTLDSFWEE